MAFATRSRRAARTQSTWTVVPFDARGAGVGEIPPTIAIETPHDGETLLVLCAEADRPDPEATARCVLALDAFRAGFATVAPRMLTNALLAGMDEANAALYDHRAARAMHRPVGVGLTALVARGPDAYVIQAGPGQALIVGDDGVTALPSLARYRMFDSAPHDERAAAPPLGMSPTVEPDLFHVDASEGLFVALTVSALGHVLHHEDDAPLRSLDPARVAEYLVSLGARFRLPMAYGAVMARDGESSTPASPPGRGSEWDRPPAYQHPHSEPRVDPFNDVRSGGAPLPMEDAQPWGRHAHAPLAPPEFADEPRWEYLGEPAPRAGNPLRGWLARRSQRATAWDDPYRPRPARQIPTLPPRLWMLLGGLLLTLLLAGLLGIVHATAAHRANDATIHALDGIAAARAKALALHDPGVAYPTLVALDGQLQKVAADGRQTKRVALERQQMTQALDTVTGVTRVTPHPVIALAHLDGTPGSHRLLLAGDDGKLYLFDREKNDWGVYYVDPAAPKPVRLFGTGSVASKVPAGDVRGLLWSNGPATTDRTRLFARTANGTWGELVVPAVNDTRPTAVAALGDGLYLLDSGVGQIVRVPFANGGAKSWTNDAAVAELRTAVDMTSDGQTLWVLLADGRVRGFVNGAPAQLIAPAATPPLTAATAVTTAPASPYLYVADGAQGRILRIRKADGKIVQALRAADGALPIVPMQSLTVDEAHGMLSYVTADGIVTVPLPPVNGV